ncbi:MULTISPECIES: hypothetical protein [Aeromonas]|uniref:hypothetical protein n=1 Tax=Aeromonas TaxID=642 RepID=UPI0022DFD7B9|nr:MULTISPECIES: hypothetical protein [Aeromonas]
MGVIYLKEAASEWQVGIAGSMGEFKWDIQERILATDFKDAAEKAQQKAIEGRGVVYSLTSMGLRLVDLTPIPEQ